MAGWSKGFVVGLMLVLGGWGASTAYAQGNLWQLMLPGVWGGADNGVIIAMAERGSSLYMGTFNVATGCELWVRVPLAVGHDLIIKVSELGFGDANNLAVLSMASFSSISDAVYVGTFNDITGGEIWVATSDGAFFQTHSDGLGASANIGIYSMAVFDGALYVGTRNSSGLEIHRFTGVTWQPAVVTGGFGNPNNRTASAMVVHDGELYVGTHNALDGGEVWRSSNGTDWTRHVAGGLAGSERINALASADGTLFVAVEGAAGVAVYAVGEGFSIQVNEDGFGDPGIEWPSAMVTFGDTVYVGTGHASTGAEVWRMNGYLDWTSMAKGGFGNADNTDAMSLVVYSGELWAGTANWATGGEVWRMVMIFNGGFETGDTSRWSATFP